MRFKYIDKQLYTFTYIMLGTGRVYSLHTEIFKEIIQRVKSSYEKKRRIFHVNLVDTMPAETLTLCFVLSSAAKVP